MIFFRYLGQRTGERTKGRSCEKNALFYRTLPCYVHFFVKLTGSSFFYQFYFLFLIPCPGRHLVRAKTCIDRWIGVVKNKKNSVPPRGFSSTMTTRNDGHPIRVGYLLYHITSQTRATLVIKYYSLSCSVIRRIKYQDSMELYSQKTDSIRV